MAHPESARGHGLSRVLHAAATTPTRGRRREEWTRAARRCSRLQQRLRAWLALEEPRTRGMLARSHQELVGALQGDQGNLRPSLHTLEARGLLVLVRSHGGTAAALSVTAGGKNWARQLAGRGEEENGGGEGELGCVGSLPASAGFPRSAPWKKGGGPAGGSSENGAS